MSDNINNHEGKKYLRKITSTVDGKAIQADIYAVLEAWGVTCQATGHAIKKLLMPGQRGKGTKIDDLRGALAAVSRAIELEMNRNTDTKEATK